MFFAFFFGVGCLVIVFGTVVAVQSARTARWPTAVAKIKQVDLDIQSNDDGTTYRVKVRYSYGVDGCCHVSDRISFCYSESSSKRHQAALYERLKDASLVEIRYNPAKPSQSSISRGMTRASAGMFAFGCSWMLLVLGIGNKSALGLAHPEWLVLCGVALMLVALKLKVQGDDDLLRRIVVLQKKNHFFDES